MAEWCECKDELTSGHVSLYVRDRWGVELWVHGKCGRPSFSWWAFYEQDCDDCGGTFSSPTEEVCQRCIVCEPHCFDRDVTVDPWQSWAVLWQVTRPEERRKIGIAS